MSQENVELVQGMFATFAGVDWVALLGDTEPEQKRALLEAFYDPDVEIEWVDTSPESGPYRGHDGLLQAFNAWLESFEEFYVEPTEFIDAGDDVVVLTVQRGKGKGSGARAEMTAAWVIEVRDRRIARWREYSTKAGALEAAGLSE